MSAFKKNPVFATALTVCATLVLGEGWFIYERWSASRDAAKAFERKKAELHAMADLVPVPTRAVAGVIEADLARAERALATMQAELKGRGAAAERMNSARVPAARTDAYFDLASFVEKTRELAKKQDVGLKPEAARFGFATYANEGPELDRIPAVFRQRQVAQYLLESLFEAHPLALLSVQREHALTKNEKEALAAAAAGTPPPEAPANTSAAEVDGPDFFAIDPRASARVPGAIDTVPFKISFTGQTAVLRTFLNKLASFELPVLVREVEVVAATGEDAVVPAAMEETPVMAEPVPASVVLTVNAPPAKTSVPKPAARPPAVAPIVAKPLSKFTVTVEYIELVPSPAAIADADATTAKPTT